MIDFDDLEAEELRCALAGERDLELPSLPLYAVLHERVIIRAAPDVGAAVLGVKLQGDVIEVAACRGPWVRLTLRTLCPEAWMLSVGDLAGLPGVRLLARVPEAREAEWRLELRLMRTQQLVLRRRLRWACKGVFGAAVQETVHIGSVPTGLEAIHEPADEARTAASSNHVWRFPRWRVFAARDYCCGEVVERCELIPLKCEMAFEQRGRALAAFDHALLWQQQDGHLSTAFFPLGFALLYRLVPCSEEPALSAQWSDDGEALLLRAARPVRRGEELCLPLGLRGALSRCGLRSGSGPPAPSRSSGPTGGALPAQGSEPERNVEGGALSKSDQAYRALLQSRLGPTATAGAVFAGPSTTHGRGVFALRPFPRNALVEMCPTLEVGDAGRDALIDFVMSFAVQETGKAGDETCAEGTGGPRITVAALGQGMVYNHKNEPNVVWSHMPGVAGGLVIITALRTIEQGEEMFIDYGQNYWASSQEDRGPGGPAPPDLYFIVGSWNDYKPVPMKLDGSWYSHRLTVGDGGRESFQILLRGSWSSTLYPSVADANPFVDHELLGPDDLGHGTNWTIGGDARDAAEPGDGFEVRLLVDARGAATAVTWQRLRPDARGARLRFAALGAEPGNYRCELLRGLWA